MIQSSCALLTSTICVQHNYTKKIPILEKRKTKSKKIPH
uniref:Uncharacterized protein n=1 Tax=Rhizophora mucronata TaxID=61149 RepID=A0A2P2PC26_RHIMU